MCQTFSMGLPRLSILRVGGACATGCAKVVCPHQSLKTPQVYEEPQNCSYTRKPRDPVQTVESSARWSQSPPFHPHNIAECIEYNSPSWDGFVDIFLGLSRGIRGHNRVNRRGLLERNQFCLSIRCD